jgi:hypothetical protein
MKNAHSQRGHRHNDGFHGHQGCFHDSSRKLLDLKEIMDSATNTDVEFSLKVFAAAFELVAMEFADLNFRSNVLLVCEQNIRHGHTLIIADIPPQSNANGLEEWHE